ARTVRRCSSEPGTQMFSGGRQTAPGASPSTIHGGRSEDNFRPLRWAQGDKDGKGFREVTVWRNWYTRPARGDTCSRCGGSRRIQKTTPCISPGQWWRSTVPPVEKNVI